MPWALSLFKNKAPVIFNQYLNQDLAKPLEKVKKQDTIIISFGFKFIIQRIRLDCERHEPQSDPFVGQAR